MAGAVNPTQTRLPISVVVPTRDRPDKLDVCLSALRGTVGPGDEIVVVDSASTTDATQAVAAAHGVRFVRVDEPGASRARNEGWRSATHDVTAFVDDDATVQPGWADAIADAFVAPEVAFVTGAIRAPADAFAEGPLPQMHDDRAFVLEPSARGALGASANLAVRRVALEAIGGFDEALGPGTWFAAAEDIDLFDRLFLAGYRGRYEPAAVVHHHQWRDRPAMVRLDYAYGKGMGARLARLLRADRRRGRVEAYDVLWRYGLRVAFLDLRRGYELGALCGFARFVGSLLSFPVALVRLPARLRGDRERPPATRR
jgi:GT2 family glycosyltransferase